MTHGINLKFTLKRCVKIFLLLAAFPVAAGLFAVGILLVSLPAKSGARPIINHPKEKSPFTSNTYPSSFLFGDAN